MTALFIGRFQPFHLGHLDVLKQIQKKYDVIKIGIGSSQESETARNPWTASFRKEMIENSAKKLDADIQVFEIPDINNDEKWVSHVQEIVGEFDVVYSGNDHVRELFQIAGLTTITQIFNLDINATLIRQKINKKEDVSSYVPAEVNFLIQD